jgi:hypothetical protein
MRKFFRSPRVAVRWPGRRRSSATASLGAGRRGQFLHDDERPQRARVVDGLANVLATP